METGEQEDDSGSKKNWRDSRKRMSKSGEKIQLTIAYRGSVLPVGLFLSDAPVRSRRVSNHALVLSRGPYYIGCRTSVVYCQFHSTMSVPGLYMCIDQVVPLAESGIKLTGQLQCLMSELLQAVTVLSVVETFSSVWKRCLQRANPREKDFTLHMKLHLYMLGEHHCCGKHLLCRYEHTIFFFTFMMI